MLQFRHGRFNAEHFLQGASEAELISVLDGLRTGLASNSGPISAIARAFLRTIGFWPELNPSDLWHFLVYRAYCDAANHPVGVATDLPQSWKRAGGGALEEVLRSYYGSFLTAQGLSVAQVPDGERARILQAALPADSRLVPDKADVLVTRVGKSGDADELVTKGPR